MFLIKQQYQKHKHNKQTDKNCQNPDLVHGTTASYSLKYVAMMKYFKTFINS